MVTDAEKRYRAAVLADTPLIASHYASKARRESSPQRSARSSSQSSQGLLDGLGSGIGNFMSGLLGGRAKMIRDVATGASRDLGMGLGIIEPDQDFYDRTRETLRRQHGEERARIYDMQMAARRAAAPSASSGSGSSISSSLRPRTRPMMSVPQSADLVDFPLMNMQRSMSGLPNMSMPANAAYLPPLSSGLMQDPDMGITGAGEQIPVTSGLIPRIPTFEEFLDATGLEDTEENRKVYIETYVRAMGG